MSSTAPIVLKNGIPTVGPWIAVVFNDAGGVSVKSNLIAARATHQGTIDNTKTGIVQLGNDTTGSAVGVTGNYATIAGGDANGATGDYSFVAGGQGNLAGGYADHCEGYSCVANSDGGNGAHAEGDSTQALNDGAHAEGSSTYAYSTADHAEGFLCVANSGVWGAHAEGYRSQATAEGAHAEGLSTQGLGIGSHAEGVDSIATYFADHAEGVSCTATSNTWGGAHAEGYTSQALNDAAHAEGYSCTASSIGSHAEGEYSVAIREGQSALASGDFATAGDAQTSQLVFRGGTPGSVANENVPLYYGSSSTVGISLENGKAYELRVTAICGAVIAAARSCRRLEYVLAVRCDGGTAVIDGVSASINSVGSAATAAFNLQFTVATNVLTITFYTGVGITAKTAVECRVEFGEVVYP
jgi:hypothetical protein